MEARPVCHETCWTNSSPAAVSRQQLIQGDRQVADTDARRVIDGVGNRSSGADDPEFANSLHTERVDMQILLVDPGHVDRADIGLGPHMLFRQAMIPLI